MAEITVDVGVRLKAMQSSVADLQKVLDGLQPNSSGFKALQRIIADINRDMDRLRIQTSKPFGSQNQFNQTEKTVDKLEESLEKVKITIDRIKFSDLKLDSNQTVQLDNFKQQLKDIKQEFTTFKADLKNQFLDNDFNKAFVEGINPNLLNKNFDEIVKNVENRVNSLGSTLAKAKADLEEFQNAAKLGEKINKIPDEGLVSQAGLGENFKKFFQINSKGVFGFKTGGGLQKGEIKQQFIKYLTEEFQLTEGQIKQLQDQTMAKDIRDLLSNKDFFNAQLNAATTANKKMSGAESAFTTASKNYENAAAVVTRLTPLLSALSNEELSLEDKQKLVNQAIREFEQECVNGVKGSKTLKDSTKGLGSNLESFKQQLGQINTQWLNLQKQQATFNSMKTAIVNFMGFNQVLNLTKKAVKEAMDHIKQLDTVMNGIAIVTDMTTADLWNQVDVYSEMAQRYGTSIQGAYEVSKIYYQAGYETNDVLTLMNETLKMSKISGLDYATTTDYMMNAIKGFKMEVADAASVVDVYSALAANTAVSQQELAEAMSKTASSMAGVGSTFEDTSAMIATMVSVTRESANNIGSAMKSIASRYGELTKDPTKLLDSEGEAMSFNKVDTALKSVGITLQTTDHQFRDFTDVIVELANKWDTLDSAQQRYIATQFAGNRQQNRFLALVSNKDLLQENMEVAAASEDTGTLQALKALDSLESKLNQVQVAYQQFYTTIGAEGIWKTVLDGVKSFIDSLNGLPKVFDKIPLGAVAVLGNLIGLIKTALLNGLTTIAQEWTNIMNNTTNNANNMAQNGGDKIGRTWIGALFSAIKEGQPKIEAAMAEAIGEGNQKSQQEVKYTGTKINTEDFLFKSYYSKSFNPNDTKAAADTYLQTLVNMEQAGTQFSQSTLNQLLDVGAAVENGSISLREAGQRAIQIIQDTGSAAENNTSKVSNFWQELGKSGSNWQKGLTGLSQSLTTIGMLLDKTTASGRIMSGVMTSLGGAVQTGVAAARVMAQDWSALPQLIMGIFNVINGVGIAWETDAEKLERLTKETENLTNESKKAKAEYNTLQRSVDKLKELEEKRYDSAEAAEEYQSAVDELAEKFPYLITGLDSAGNAIIETSNLEHELENARKAAAKATLEAAKAEYDKIQADIEIKKSEQEERKNKLKNKSAMEGIQHSKKSLSFDTDELEILNQERDNFSYANNYSDESIILQWLASVKDFQGIGLNVDNTPFIKDSQAFIKSIEEFGGQFDPNSTNAMERIAKKYLDYYNINLGAFYEIDQAIKNLDTDVDDETLKANIDEIITKIEENNLQEDFKTFMQYAGDYNAGFVSLEELKKSLTSAAKIELSTAIKTYGKNQQEFVTNLGEGNGILTQFLYDQAEAYQNAEKGDLQQYINTQLNNDYQKFETAYNNLLPKEQEKFLDMWKNRSQYTAEDFRTVFDFSYTDPILLGIREYYQEQIPNYQEMLSKKNSSDLGGMRSDISGVRSLTLAVAKGKDFISKDLMSWLSGIVDLVSEYSKNGKITSANTISTNAAAILNELTTITDPSQRASIVNVMNEYGLTTISGVTSIIDNLQKISGTENIIINLNNLKDALTYNIPLAIQAYTDQIVSEAEDLEKNIKNISNGMSITEAVAALEKINSTEGVTATLADFTEKNGQFYLKDAEMRDRYFKAVIDGETKELESLQGEVNNFANNKQQKRLETIFGASLWGVPLSKDEYSDIYDTLNQLGLVEDVFDESGKDVIGFKAIIDKWEEFSGENGISEAIYLYLTGQLASAEEVSNYIQKVLPAKAALEAGEYRNYFEKLLAEGDIFIPPNLEQIARGDYSSTGNLKYEQVKPVQEKINSVYSTLISDAFSKGLDKLDSRDYEGLIDDSFDAGEEGPHRYEEFIRRYADLAGKSIEETNALIVQAIEKDAQTTTAAAAEAVSKIQWLSSEGKGFAALKDIQTLADALGISVDKILGEYNNQLDMYLVDLSNVEGIDLSKVDNFAESVYDSINNFLKSITDGVLKGISGKLSSTDITTLNGQLDQLGIKGLGKTDFIETAEGLKISQKAAIDLYTELKKIDALQGQLVFNDLAKSLEASDTNYTNISTTLARIAELEKAIKEMKPDDARLQMYKNELAVAQEIARTRSSTDNKDFNFMDRALPTGMQNPIDYWNATGEAYKVMNASAKSGYMEIQDFYNIVQEMSNMAQVSGQTLHFMGQEIDGSAETAAALIQRGFSALTNVKGDGVKIALGNIGTDFKTGAADMKGDFDSGVREMAKAQIKMLDAAINMLEAIVAMENIGDIDTDGNGIDYGELFDDIWDPNNEEWITKWDKDAQITIDEIVKAGEKNPELKKAFESFYLEGYSFWELLKDDGEKLTKIGKEGRDKLVEAFNIINELANSDDWEIGNLEQIYKKIEASGLQDLFSQHIYNEEAGFSLIITPDIQTEIDWNSPEIEKRLKETGFKTDEEAREFLDAFAKGEKTEPIDYVTIKILSGDIEITDENTYKYHGQEFTDKTKLAEIIDKERSFDAELNNIDTESNTVTFSKTIGLQKVTIVQEEDGTTTYKFEDGTIIKASDEKTALKLYAENYRQMHSSLANLSDEEILMQRHLLVEEQVEIKINEKVDKQIRDNAETFRNHTVQEINEAIEKGKPTANGKGIIIELGNETFTLGGTKEELSGKGQEIADLAAQELGIDTALSTTISDGISQAFSGEGGAAIGKAIKEGIITAFNGSTETGTDGMPIDNINVIPTTVTIKVADATQEYEGIPEEGYSIPTDKLPLVKAILASLGIDLTGAEEQYNGLLSLYYIDPEDVPIVEAVLSSLGLYVGAAKPEYNGLQSLYVIPNEKLPKVNGYLSQLGLTVLSGATADFDGAGLTKTYQITNTQLNATGEVGTLTISVGAANENGETPYEVTWTGDFGDIEYTEQELTGLVKIKEITYEYTPEKNGNGDTTTEVTAIVGYTPPSEIIAANNVKATAEVTDVTFVYKKNNDTGKDELQEIKTNITDKEGNQITIPVGVDVNPDQIRTDIENALTAAGFSKEEATANAEAIIQANASIIPNLKTDDPTYTAAIASLEEKGIDLTVGAVAGTVANEVDAIIAEQEKKNIELPVKAKKSPFSDYGEEGRNQLTTHRIKRNGNWEKGDLDLLLSGSARGNTKGYINDLENLTNAGEKISKVDFSNLEYLKHLIEQDPSSNDNSGIYDQITKILSMSETIESDNLAEISNLAQSFSGLEVGELPEIATALQDIVIQAGLLQDIEWDKIVEGITNVTNAQTGQSPDNNNSGNGIGNDSSSDTNLLDTSSLATAVAELSEVVEAFNGAAESVNNVATAMSEIKTDQIKEISKIASEINSAPIENVKKYANEINSSNAYLAKTYINSIDATNANLAKEAINGIDGNINLAVKINVATAGATGNVEAATASKGSVSHTSTSATWNIAKATGTLMGELGPELVVSHGRYFVVGQNGPEMVDLADDAIVFNHLQTNSLLKKGRISTTGKPITNERKAVSFATGNVEGPAMASPSAALSTLKQLRAMWQSLLDASLKDMGAMGGGAGGGGGGGGGNTAKAVDGIVADVERWYNWLKKIETTQNNINKLTKKYTLLEKQGINSNKRLENLQSQYKNLQENAATRQQLIEEQKKYRKKVVKSANKGFMSAFYTADENTGQVNIANDKAFVKYIKSKRSSKVNKDILKRLENSGKITKGTKIDYEAVVTQEKADKKAEKEYKEWLKTDEGKAADEKKQNEKREAIQKAQNEKVGSKETRTLKFSSTIKTGLDFMEELQRTKNGKLVHDAQEQYAMIKAMGLNTKDLMEGVDKTQEGWEAQVVQNFYDAVEMDKEKIESLTDSINEQTEAALDDKIAMQEINEQIREIYKTVPGVNEGLDKWHNYTRKIADEQNRLNKLTKEYSLLQNDQIGNGEEIYKNLKEQLNSYKEQQKLGQDYLTARKEEAQTLISESGALANFYTQTESGSHLFNESALKGVKKTINYQTSQEVKRNAKGYEIDEKGQYVDENGVLRNKKGKEVKNGTYGQTQVIKSKTKQFDASGSIVDIINRLTEQTATGEMVYDAAEQYQIIKGLGLEDFIKFDESGSQIYSNFGEMADEDKQKAVEIGIKRIQDKITELNDNNDEIVKLEEEDLDIQNEILSIENTLRDNAIDVKNQLRDAIVQERQDSIDERNEIKEAIKDAADKTVEGLKESLEKERQTYDSDQNEKELTLLQMQLAAAQTTSGSIAKVRDLQQQIQEKQKDIYFDQRELGIEEIEDAANRQVEALETQIDLMQTALDYQVENGLIWKEVNNKLSEESISSVVSYILNNNPEFIKANSEEQQKMTTQTTDEVGLYKANVDDQIAAEEQEYKEKINNIVNNAVSKDQKNKYQGLFTPNYLENLKSLAESTYQNATGTEEEKLAFTEKELKDYIKDSIADFDTEGLSSLESFMKEKENLMNTYHIDSKEDKGKIQDAYLEEYYRTGSIYDARTGADELIKNLIITNSKTVDTTPTTPKSSDNGLSNFIKKYSQLDSLSINEIKKRYLDAYASTGSVEEATLITRSYADKLLRDFINKNRGKKFAKGGEIDFTGLAWVDGSKKKPEYILNAEQVDTLKQGLFNNVNLMGSLVNSLKTTLEDSVNNTYSTINNAEDSIVIENVEINMNIDEVASDYDSRRIGQQAFDEMVKIARKTGNRSISRR